MDSRQKRLEEMMQNGGGVHPNRSVAPPASSPARHGKRQFVAAAAGRLRNDWPSINMSSDEELYRDLRALRGRSRWLAKNNGYYRRFLDMCVDNIVGPVGVRLEAKVRSRNDELDRAANSAIEDAWRRWGRKGVSMRRSQWTRTDAERAAVFSVARDGEVFIRKWYGVGEFGFQLEMIDAMRVPVEMNRVEGAAVQIINGIEYTDGEATAYYIAKRGMKSDFMPETYERVDAKFILHLYEPVGPEQKRGFPWLAAGMDRIHMLDRYENAEIIASRIAAEKGGFFSRTAAADSGFTGDDGDSEKEIQMMDSEAGSFGLLPEGYQFQSWDPTHPTSAFESLSNKLLKGIASAGNINYTSLANDLSDVNYSSARIGMLEVRDNWKAKQNWFVGWFHEAIYAEWLRMAMSAGALKLTWSRIADYERVSWIGRSWAWIDPLKEASANMKNVQMRIKSLSDVAAEQGMEFEDVIERIAKEKELAASAGVDMSEVFGQSQTTK
jgi:lambda family phage portal protein